MLIKFNLYKKIRDSKNGKCFVNYPHESEDANFTEFILKVKKQLVACEKYSDEEIQNIINDLFEDKCSTMERFQTKFSYLPRLKDPINSVKKRLLTIEKNLRELEIKFDITKWLKTRKKISEIIYYLNEYPEFNYLYNPYDIKLKEKFNECATKFFKIINEA